MIQMVSEKRRELIELCRKAKVMRLDLFGSAATGAFNPATSDLDFLVEFDDRPADGLLNRYLDLVEALEKLFNRHVDLLTSRSIRNPFFSQTIAATRQTLYDHRTQAAHS